VIDNFFLASACKRELFLEQLWDLIFAGDNNTCKGGALRFAKVTLWGKGINLNIVILPTLRKNGNSPL
jgi:hypothetical protein